MTTTNTTNTTATARTGWAALLLTFVMALVASIGVGGKPADAAPAHIPASAPASAVPAVGGPAHALPASSPIHSVVLPRYSAGDCFAGITALGRSLPEAYHRLNSFTAEVRRNIIAEQLAAAKGTKPVVRSEGEVAAMYRHADSVIYPVRAKNVIGDAAE